MPMYEYYCKVCQGKFEALKPVYNRESCQCPVCGEMAGKIFSSFNFTFGWVLSDRSLNERFAPKEELVKNI